MANHDRDIFFSQYLEDSIMNWLNKRLLPLFDKWNMDNSDLMIHPREFINPRPEIRRFNVVKVGGADVSDNNLNLALAGIDSPVRFGRRQNMEDYYGGDYAKFYEIFVVWATNTYDDEGLKLPQPPPAEQIISDSPVRQKYHAIEAPQNVPGIELGVANPLFNSMDPPPSEESESDRDDEKKQVAPGHSREYAEMQETLDPDGSIGELETIPGEVWAKKARQVQEENFFWDQTSTVFWIAIGIFVLILWALITRRGRH